MAPHMPIHEVVQYCWETLHKNGSVCIDVMPHWQPQVGLQITYRRTGPCTYALRMLQGLETHTLASNDALMQSLHASVANYAQAVFMNNEFWNTVVHRREIRL